MSAISLYDVSPPITLSNVRSIGMRFQSITMHPWAFIHDWQLTKLTSSQDKLKEEGKCTLHDLFSFVQHHMLYSLSHFPPTSNEQCNAFPIYHYIPVDTIYPWVVGDLHYMLLSTTCPTLPKSKLHLSFFFFLF